MAGNNVILLKRSSIPSLTPSVTSLSAGELAINVSDGTLFTKKIFGGVEEIVTFSNNNTTPYKYIPALSAIQPADDATQNTVTQSFGTVLGGYYNDVSGGGSTVINGENNDIAADYALIGGGVDNIINASGDYGAILGGTDNTLNHQESFIIGSNITSHASNFTYVNNLSATNKIYGDGSGLTGIITGDTEATTLVRTNSASWNAAYSNQANYLPLSGGTVTGSLSVLGNVTYLDTAVGVTSAMYIDAATTEPALRITQSGTGDVIRVEDTNNPDSTPFIINSDGVVGVGTSLPNEKLTVVGNVSATGFYYGDGSNLTGIVHDDTAVSTLVRTNSANWDAAYTGVSSLSSALSAVSTNTSLSSSVTSDVNVGGIAIAQVIPQNTTFQGFVEALLTKIYYPVLTAPSASMSSNIGTEVEAGTQGITLTVNLNRGAITGKTVSGIWDPNTLQDYRSGAATQYVILGVNNGTTSSYTSATAIIQEGTNTFSGSVTHASGPQPVDSKNQNYSSSLASGTLSTSVNVYGRRKAFYGVSNNAANSSDIRSLSNSLLNPSNGSTFQISIPIGATNVVFAYPSSLRNVTSVLYEQGFDADVKGNFSQTTVSVEGANGYSATTYKVYKYTPVQAFTQAATYNVTI